MIDANKPNVSSAVENLADAVTHARYICTCSTGDMLLLPANYLVLEEVYDDVGNYGAKFGFFDPSD